MENEASRRRSSFFGQFPWYWILLIIGMAALPMLIVTVPDASDYPNHLARHYIFSTFGQGTALDTYFRVDWRWVGNLGVDLPAIALTPLLGVETATRLISALIAPLTVIGILYLSRCAHGRVTASAMLALPFTFAQPFLFGFLNYCLSVALALIVAAAWYANRRTSIWRMAAFGLAAIAVWTAHIMGWAILLILIAGAELATLRGIRDLPMRTVRALPLLLPVIPLLIWRSGGTTRLYWYEPSLLSSKVMNFVTAFKGLSMPFDLAMVLIISVAAIIAFLWAGGRKVEPRLTLSAILLLLAALILPTTMLGSWGADLRLTPVAMMVAIMAIGPARRPANEKLLFILGASLFLIRAGWTSVQWWKADQIFQSRLRLLDKVPQGERLGFLSVDARCHEWALSADRKIGAYAITRRDAFTNTLFQIPGSDIMIIRSPSDSARWYDGSQDIPAICPQGKPDLNALQSRMVSMAKDDFTALWIAGLNTKAIPALPGYAIAYTSGTDTLLLRAHP